MNRQIIYLVGMGVLLTAAWLWRDSVVNPYANSNGLREEEIGNVELTGRAVELALTGSRGMAVAYLWYEASELQKKHRWNEVELVVRSLTKLQPHFITPWLFQSWNFAYNVYAEVDRPREKLYYLSRGCEMLAEGERRNRFSPDLRFNLGLYQQHKINQSDETNVMRSLFQLACIPPADREPRRFQVFDEKGLVGDPGQEVRWNRFQAVREEFRAKDPLAQWRLRLRMARKPDFDTVMSLLEVLLPPDMVPVALPLSASELAIAWMSQTEQGNTSLGIVPPLGAGLWGAMGTLPLLLERQVAADGTLVPESRFDDYRAAHLVDAALVGYRLARGDKVLGMPVATSPSQIEAMTRQREAIDLTSSITPREKLLAQFDRAERELEVFCKRFPSLAMRLREGTRPEMINARTEGARGKARRRTQFICETTDAFIRFLEDSQGIPSLYEADAYRRPQPNGWRAPDTLAALSGNTLTRFPSLPGKPDRVPGVNGEYDPSAPIHYNALKPEEWLNDQFDAWATALAWYRYAQEPIPPPSKIPGDTSPVTDRLAQRKPRYMATLIFRTQPGLMQARLGNRLMREGWFDTDEGDTDSAREGSTLAMVPGGGRLLKDWIPDRPILIGNGLSPLAATLAETERVWRDIAGANGMVLDPLEERNRDQSAILYREKYLFTPELMRGFDGDPQRLAMAMRSAQIRHDKPELDWTPEMKQSWENHYYLREYDSYRQMSNFRAHYVRALAEKNPAAAIAHKRFFEADTLSRFQALLNERDALRIFRRPDAFLAWREKIILEPRQRSGWFSDQTLRVLSDYGRDDLIQEENYLLEMRYQQLASEQEEPQISAARKYLAREFGKWLLAGNLAAAQAGAPAAAQLASLGVERQLAGVLAKLDEVVPFQRIPLVQPMLDFLDESDWPGRQEIIPANAKGSVEGRDGEVIKERPPVIPLPPLQPSP